ncbi:MAG: hypothetical protein HYZ28_12495 [Myxococcales bacterium]|nr:hypothetical protein [Myxococcales bacterium]
MPPQGPSGQSELFARYVYAAPLAQGKRVLEIGAVASTFGLSALLLVKRGAASVVACDEPAEAVKRAERALTSPQLSFAADYRSLEAASFDLLLFADLSRLPPDPDGLETVLRLLDRGGYLLGAVALSSPSLSQHEEISSRLSKYFSSIQQVRFTLASGASLEADGGGDHRFDSSLAGPVDPAQVLLLAGERPARLPSAAWIQLPPEVAGVAGGQDRIRALEAEVHEARVELVDRQAEAHELSRQLAKLHKGKGGTKSGSSRELAAALEVAHEQLKRAAGELRRALDESSRLRQQLSDAEARIEQESSQRAGLAVRVAEARSERSAREAQLSEAKAEVESTVNELAQRDVRLAELTTRAETAEAALEKSVRRLAVAEAEQQRLTEDRKQLASAVESQVARLERERDEAVQALTVERERTKRLVEALERETARATAQESARAAAEASLAGERARLHSLELSANAAREEASSFERQVQGLMREIASVSEEKAELERKLSSEKLERARLERARSSPQGEPG